LRKGINRWVATRYCPAGCLDRLPPSAHVTGSTTPAWPASCTAYVGCPSSHGGVTRRGRQPQPKSSQDNAAWLRVLKRREEKVKRARAAENASKRV